MTSIPINARVARGRKHFYHGRLAIGGEKRAREGHFLRWLSSGSYNLSRAVFEEFKSAYVPDMSRLRRHQVWERS